MSCSPVSHFWAFLHQVLAYSLQCFQRTAPCTGPAVPKLEFTEVLQPKGNICLSWRFFWRPSGGHSNDGDWQLLGQLWGRYFLMVPLAPPTSHHKWSHLTPCPLLPGKDFLVSQQRGRGPQVWWISWGAPRTMIPISSLQQSLYHFSPLVLGNHSLGKSEVVPENVLIRSLPRVSQQTSHVINSVVFS